MPRYDDRYANTRLYVGHLAARTRSRDLEHLFSKYGRLNLTPLTCSLQQSNSISVRFLCLNTPDPKLKQ
ncbi:hypothetical protein SADUNF_Sadunf16G0087800 [Salix dunnii]|uniref:Arginine/serine-rich splicing factor n=1 Tax=Salix dunnii TaxID=1413687 RepID=A0A835MG12_9ROSI|nr:hypothetical protein SADUNF_Sadunf16G0087800 [Salix dunnii]